MASAFVSLSKWREWSTVWREWDKFLEFYPWGRCIILSVVGPNCERRKLLPLSDKIHLSAQSEVSELQDSRHNKPWEEKVHSSPFPSEIIHCNIQRPLPGTDGKSPGKNLCGDLPPFERGIVTLIMNVFHTSPKSKGSPSFHWVWSWCCG